MGRVEAKGVSAYVYDSVDELIEGNRAGRDETCLSKEQIIEWYCRRKDDKNLPFGKRFNFDTEEYEDVPDEIQKEEGQAKGGGDADGK